MGNLTAVTDANGHSTHYTYDPLDRLETVRDPLDGLTVYAYDAVGNLTQATDAESHSTHYSYDALNRLLSATDPLSHTTHYAYDAVGNTMVITDADQLVTTFSYDQLYRLTGVQYPDGSVGYTYDAVGNRLSMTDGTGTTTYAYDALYRPLTITAPYGGPVGYRYDAVGNRTQTLYPTGETVAYDYDAAGRLVGLSGWDSQEASYGYDPAGRVRWQRQPNGVQTDYGYDPAGRQVRVEHSDWPEWAGLEPVTSPSALADGETITYSYDAAGRLIGAGYASGDYYGYAYDRVGNRTVLTTTAGTTGYVYDAADRLVSVDGVACTYDHRGNLLSDGTWSYTYNAAGRLVRAETITATQVYTYNGDGLLLAQSIDGVETRFVWDQALAIPQILATSDGVKTLYGLERLVVFEGGAWHYPQHDALGSVRQWTDAAAAVLAMQAYSPFGVPRAALAVAPWGFTGEWHDPGGLVYLRARWYNPSWGRFTQADSFRANLPGLATRHPYAYALGDPTRYTDPTGQTECLYGDCSLRMTPNGNIIAANLHDSALYAAIARIAHNNGSARQALEAILLETESVPEVPVHFGGLAATRGDRGFAREFQDDYLYRELWGCRTPQSQQLGHFLTAVGMGYKAATHPEDEVMRGARLILIVGHEMYRDAKGSAGMGPSTVRQLLEGLRGDGVACFEEAVRLDAAGQYEARDAQLYAIFDPARHGAPRDRLGNSMEDLRLSVRGWRLGHIVASGGLGTNRDLANWLALYVAG